MSRDTGSHSHLNDEEFGALIRQKPLKDDEIRPYWEGKARNLLQDRVVHAVRYMEDEELDNLGWDFSALVIQLNDPTGKKGPVLIYASSDDEGNNAGALFTDDDDVHTLPVLRDVHVGKV
jgi:hypothetical protein